MHATLSNNFKLPLQLSYFSSRAAIKYIIHQYYQPSSCKSAKIWEMWKKYQSFKSLSTNHPVKLNLSVLSLLKRTSIFFIRSETFLPFRCSNLTPYQLCNLNGILSEVFLIANFSTMNYLPNLIMHSSSFFDYYLLSHPRGAPFDIFYIDDCSSDFGD